MALKMTTLDILKMRERTYRVACFRRMRDLTKILNGSRIEISKFRQSNTIWPVYNLVSSEGKILATLHSVEVRGLGLVNDFYQEF